MGRFKLPSQKWSGRGRNFSVIGTKYLIDTGGRHLSWLGDSQLCCEPTSFNWHLESQPQFSLEKKPSVIPDIFVVRAQMHKTCCEVPDLEWGSWICISSMEVRLTDLASFSLHTYKEQEPKPDSPALQAITTGIQSQPLFSSPLLENCVVAVTVQQYSSLRA